MAEEMCANCGAPRAAGYASCKYCQTPFVANAQTNAIPCPQCKTLNEVGAQKCVQCQTWIVVQCVFCHAISAYNLAGCVKCGEAFAGAPQRLAERQRAEHLQTGLQVAGTVGNVAASFLGAAAGAGMFSQHHHGYDYVEPVRPPDSGPGFFDSLFGGSSSDNVSGGAGIAQSSGDSPGFFDSLVGGSSDSSSDDSSSDDSDDDS